MKRPVIGFAAAFACGLAFAAPVVAGHGPLQAPPVEGPAPNVLYSQNDTDSGIAIVSQQFGSSFDAYDSIAADDFVVKAVRKWVVTAVDVRGRYFNGSGLAQSENVTFYKNRNGFPAEVIADLPGVHGQDDGYGSLKMQFPKIRLHDGTVWLSVQAVMDLDAGGEWGWENQTTVVKHPAVWVNPGDGFGTGCTQWGPESQCIPEGEADHMFTIRGRSD